MHETAPSVFLVARPSLDLDGLRGYLADVGGASWLERRVDEADGSPNAAQLLIEFGGRACYRSWEPGLNPNVTRVRTDQREYFANLLRSAHGSVLEHASFSFALRNVSRVDDGCVRRANQHDEHHRIPNHTSRIELHKRIAKLAVEHRDLRRTLHILSE